MTTANSRKEKESKIVLQMEQEVSQTVSVSETVSVSTAASVNTACTVLIGVNCHQLCYCELNRMYSLHSAADEHHIFLFS